jgi:hypothetical protein
MITAELCETCSDDATTTLDGVPLCKECHTAALELLMTPPAHAHVGNHHPATPLSEQRYEGMGPWVGGRPPEVRPLRSFHI